MRSPLSRIAEVLIGFAGVGVVAAVWCWLTYGGLVGRIFLPRPIDMWQGLVAFHHQNWLIPAIWRSFRRVTESLLLVITVGVPIGILMGTFRPLDAFLRRIVSAGKSIPTTGVAGLIVLWFSVEERAKIVFLFIGAIFYMITLVRNAVLKVPEDYIRIAVDLGANQWQVVWRVLLPGALPQIWEAVAVCNGIMWTYIVLAEYINGNENQLGLGYLLFIGSRGQDSGKVFATLTIIAAISSFTDFILHSTRRRFVSW